MHRSVPRLPVTLFLVLPGLVGQPRLLVDWERAREVSLR